MKREDGSWYTKPEMAEKIRRLEIENDNVREENMKLRALFDQVSEHVIMETEEDYPIG